MIIKYNAECQFLMALKLIRF